MGRVEFEQIAREVKSPLFTLFVEKILPPLKLESRASATLETAREMDSQKGDYRESANLYYSVLENSQNNIERLDARFGLVQQLINLGRFGQAKDSLLENQRKDLEDFDTRTKMYYSARTKEKLGWIADYEGDYEKARSYFSSIISASHAFIPSEAEMTEGEKQVYSTAVHFLGRAYYGLGEYEYALKYFNEHLANPKLKNVDQGFGHAWLARCYIKLGEPELVEEEIVKTRELFEEYLKDNPERGIMAHYYLLNGTLEFTKGNFVEARNSFETAFTIRREKEHYPKGESDALFGIAGTYWAERNYGAAFVYALRGLKTYPLSLLKPSL